ncbi:MAG TPA: bacitracin resistance protein BacA [Leptospiraceae bacterium]|nr:bacitracin resistance protein BacA [Leptospiraceae bacterium]
MPNLFKNLGEEKIRSLANFFYKEIALSAIRPMYPEDLKPGEEKLADFLIQVMGGPAYYSRKYGHPRMRARHFPFEIDEKARRVWLSCFKKALDAIDVNENDKVDIYSFLTSFSAWMVNKA